MKDKYRYKAEIAGKIYTIVGDRPSQHLDAVVDLLNQQLEQLGQLDPNLSREDRSILMAINAISDQISKENRIVELEAELAVLKSDRDYHQSADKTHDPSNLEHSKNTVRVRAKSSQDQDK
ncbi:cell division protein ZapA [Facklamia sp. DSM 111018]|uniref:Cell division protein ZapA n=1 Tax=Facklamia lactis TaxID=2749967 RepID=A0ABS0LPE6_9LACT|nr:cell division protein ZapA [Facklamia lactis]MBG9980171.1 cell division protein ZapA [Facklamia lactis]MBG9985973.1 cell division protein ZapA [Facklamia lactis]